MDPGINVDVIDGIEPMVAGLCTGWARSHPHLVHADVRIAVTQARAAGAENGEPRFARDDYACAMGVRVLAGRRMVGAATPPRSAS